MKGPLPAEVHQALFGSLGDSLRKLRDELADFNAGAVVSDAGRVRIGAELHSVRGAFAMIHATEIADACGGLEKLLAEGDFSSLAAGIDALDASSHAVLRQRSPSA